MSAGHPSLDGGEDDARSRGRSTPVRTVPAGGMSPRPRHPARSDGGQALPPSRQRKRRTRLWMVLLLLTPVCLAVISLLTFATGGPPEPTVRPLTTPAGYRAVTDAYFGYSVPDAYRENSAWEDQNADFFYGEPGGFVAETLEITKRSPTPRTAPPESLQVFGEPDPVAYSTRDGHRIQVPGTSFAWEESVTRPGGYRAVAVDAWERATSTQVWLLVHSPAAVTARVLASLRG